MSKLNNKEEDYILEAGLEKIDEEFSDWLSDNKSTLKNEFVDNNEDAFMEYCREEFKIWRESK